MLKSLQLAGFKSFAEKTRLEFPAGVTVVVGPNGSGKSNVVDAVKWVLGSQSPRSLRGKEMTDVIFNGAESRGPMNAAEVTLAFDNTPPADGGRRLFDLDEEEIRLTRRVSRSGEGEYLVNGRTCRLKDFRELLAGTGVGADSYSIIEQGRVDAALRASPLERRLLLEEAAGISRFRLRKREAMKRLERVEQNLLRLSDIVDEVEGRLRRVRSQAGKARRYREASLRLKEARTELASADWQQLANERRHLESEQEDVAKRLEAARAALVEDEDRLKQLEESAAGEDRVEHALRVAQQRLARAERVAAIARVESERADEQLGRATAALFGARQELADAEPSDEARQALAAAESTAQEYATAVERAEGVLAKQRSRLADATHHHEAHAARRKRVEALRRRVTLRLERTKLGQTEATGTLNEIASEGEATLRLVEQASQELAAATAERDAATDALLASDERIAGLQRELAASRRELKVAQSRLAERRATLVGWRHRLEVIQEEEGRLDRLNADVQRVVKEASSRGDTPPRVYGLVADLLHVEEDFVPVIEAALGPRVEHVVVDSRAALLAAVTGLHADQKLLTRAVFQALDGTAAATAVDQIDLAREPGVVGRATEYVEVEPRFAALVRRLLGRTWFVENLSAASRLSSSIGAGVTFVTLDGEVLGEDGGVHCGPSNASLRMLTRRHDAAELRQQIAEGESELADDEHAVQQTDKTISQLEAAISVSQAEASEQRGCLADAAQQAAALEERRRNARASVQRLRSQHGERVAVAKQREATLSLLSGRAKRLAAIEVSDQPGTVADALRSSESQVAAAEARLAELRAAESRHRQLLESIRREAKSEAPAEHESLTQAIESRAVALADAKLASSYAACKVLTAADTVSQVSLEVDGATRLAAQTRTARAASERIRAELGSSIAQARGEIEALTRRYGEVELRAQRLDLEATAVAQRVRDDYGLDVTTQPATETDTPVDRSGLRAEIEKLREEVKRVGSVNLESLEELDALETRFEELSGQYEDLTQAKQSLARLTTRIDADSRELFKATFETVRGHFRELFSRLFGGGEADLVLTEPPDGPTDADLLDGGVEIVACPPGKELRNLSLMSGGEKTMTCVALLLALFRSRPSPFCLLDEVDAALDEANVGRFLEVLKDFLGSTQFLVISHSKRTMSGADTIYGVTMQESGVSKQISVRFEDVAEDGTIRLRRPSGDGTLPIKRAA